MRKITLLYLVAVGLAVMSGCSKQSAPEQAAAPAPAAAGAPAAAAPAAQPAAPAAQPAAPAAAPAAKTEKPAASHVAKSEAPAAAKHEAPAPPPPTPIVIPAGTNLVVRLDSALDTKENQAGDRFTATLEEPVVVDGKTVIAKGSTCVGKVTESAASGRMKGKAEIAITLDTVEVGGVKHAISTGTVSHESGGHKTRNIGLIAGGAGLGAAIGAIAGGGKGAAIGAAAGAGAGTAGAVATGKQNAGMAAESMVTFSLKAPLKL